MDPESRTKEKEMNVPKSALVIAAAPATSAALVKLFTQIGWTVHEVQDNHAALAAVEARAYDLVVTGEKTSGKEDIDLFRRMRAIHPHARIVILTAESTPDDVVASMRERAYSYFSQPFSLDALVDMVRMAAEGPCWDDGIEVLSATSAWIRLLARCERKTADRLLQFFHEMAFLPRRRKGISCLRLPRNSAERDGTWRPLRPKSICRDRICTRTPYGGVPGQRSRRGVFARRTLPGSGVESPRPPDPTRRVSRKCRFATGRLWNSARPAYG